MQRNWQKLNPKQIIIFPSTSLTFLRWENLTCIIPDPITKKIHSLLFNVGQLFFINNWFLKVFGQNLEISIFEIIVNLDLPLNLNFKPGFQNYFFESGKKKTCFIFKKFHEIFVKNLGWYVLFQKQISWFSWLDFSCPRKWRMKIKISKYV